MSLLRSDRLAALNDLILACREAAACHANVAEVSSDRALGEALSALAKDREAVADVLAEAVLAEEDLPRAPQSEKTLLETTAQRIKATLSADKAASLLQACEEKDRDVAETATSLLGHELNETLRQDVVALRDDAASRVARLKRAHDIC